MAHYWNREKQAEPNEIPESRHENQEAYRYEMRSDNNSTRDTKNHHEQPDSLLMGRDS